MASHPSRPNNVKRRKTARLRRANNNLKEFLTAQAARLLSSASGRDFTATAATDVCAATAHGFVTGKGPIALTNDGGALPAGTSATVMYWPIRVDADSFKLATSRKKAFAGTAVDITGTGTGTHTAKYAVTVAALMERLRDGVTHRALRAATDIDNL